MTSRARPKPRFAGRKAEPATTSGSELPSSPGPSASTSSLLQDEDAFFTRNKNRQATTWQQFDKRGQRTPIMLCKTAYSLNYVPVEAAAAQRANEQDDEEDSDEPVPLRVRNSPQKGSKTKPIANWDKKMKAYV